MIVALIQLTDGAVDEAEEQRENDELRVPDVTARYSRDAEEHKDDGFSDRRQHLEHVPDGYL